MGGDAYPVALHVCACVFRCVHFVYESPLQLFPLSRLHPQRRRHQLPPPITSLQSLLWRAEATVWNKITAVVQDVKELRISQPRRIYPLMISAAWSDFDCQFGEKSQWI